MTQHKANNDQSFRSAAPWIVLVAAAALAAGAPTIKGGLVGGDDKCLVRDHVLVNHPSLEHAVQLFSIIHRDLYQPIPLLSFSAEFALGQALGLFDRGIEGGQWLFHLTNIMLHAVNAVLVWMLILRLSQKPGEDDGSPRVVEEVRDGGRRARIIATATALLFAVHPLQMEVIAWVNGRMMLLSTMFALLSLLAFVVWLRDGRRRWALATLAMLTLCMISKVRVGVPLLMFAVAFARGHRLDRRFWPVFLSCSGIMAAALALNLWATAGADLFEAAAEHLHGPTLVRVMLSLAWYVEHFLWPSGLASWYHAPRHVRWFDVTTATAIGTLLVTAIVMFLPWKRSLAVRLGLLWFLVAIADTLPFLPVRNILAADRYMYLPIVGLAWVAGLGAAALYRRLALNASSVAPSVALGSVAVVLCAVLTGLGWHVGSYYENTIKKTSRIIELHPQVAHVWSRLAWAYEMEAKQAERVGDLATATAHRLRAIGLADRELQQEDPDGWSEAHQARGTALMNLGRIDEALESLKLAIVCDPDDGEPIYRLGMAYDDLGRYAEALPLLEASFAQAQRHNPTIRRLAKLYRRAERFADARRMFEHALENNSFDVPSILGLAELDNATGEAQRIEDAERRLRALLRWMPENVEARTLLGVTLYSGGKIGEAVACYERVLQEDPQHATAAINLAQIFLARGDAARADALFARAARSGPDAIEQVIAIEDRFITTRRFDDAVALWIDYLGKAPGTPVALSHAAWVLALAGKTAEVESFPAGTAEDSAVPLTIATRAYLALVANQHEASIGLVEQLCAMGAKGSDARRRLMTGLEAFDEQRPNVPWTFYLVARLLAAEGRSDAAGVFTGLFEQHCQDEMCAAYLKTLRDQLE